MEPEIQQAYQTLRNNISASFFTSNTPSSVAIPKILKETRNLGSEISEAMILATQINTMVSSIDALYRRTRRFMESTDKNECDRVCADCMQLVKYDDDSKFDDEDVATYARQELADMNANRDEPFRAFDSDTVYRNAGQTCECCGRVSDALYPIV